MSNVQSASLLAAEFIHCCEGEFPVPANSRRRQQAAFAEPRSRSKSGSKLPHSKKVLL
jgi:hypothetical protein